MRHSVIVHDTTNATAQRNCVEIQQQSDALAAELQVCEQLSDVQRQKTLDCLHLYDDTLIDQEIDAIAWIEPNVFVVDRESNLSRHLRASKLKLVAKAGLVRRFEQSGSKFPVHFERCAQNSFGRGVGHKQDFTAENTEKSALSRRPLRSLRLTLLPASPAA